MSIYICTLLFCLAVSTVADTDLDQTCTIDADCPDNSACLYIYDRALCEDSGCFCNDGYFAYENACEKKVEIDEPCTSYAECASTTIGSRCSGIVGNKVCECDPRYGTHVIDIDGLKYCYTSKFDEPCQTVEECLAYHFGHSICDPTDGCTCAAGYKQSDDRCVQGTHGEECEVGQADLECDVTKNLVCTQDVCVCEVNFIWDAAHDTCIHQDATQVGDGEECDDGLDRYDNDGEYCPITHECKTCPGGGTDTQCLNEIENDPASTKH